MNKHGRPGVRMALDGRARPYYARVRFQGQEINTQYYATADQAGLAYEIMAGVFQSLNDLALCDGKQS